MSRRDGIENLLGGTAASAAPTVTEMKQQAEGKTPSTSGAADKPDPKSTGTLEEPTQRGKTSETRRPTKREGQAIRFQVSAPAGSEVEQALLDALNGIPEPLRAGVNIGSLFRKVLIENDVEIAKMIRSQLRKV